MSTEASQVISFKQTTLFKRGIWLTAAGLIAFVVTPSALDGSLWQNPIPPLIALTIVCAFCAYGLWSLRIYRIADVVTDCEDHLVVRRRGVQEIIPLANIAKAQVFTRMGIHRITIHLRLPTRLGAQVDFLPQASLWSSLSGVQEVADDLADRAAKRPGELAKNN